MAFEWLTTPPRGVFTPQARDVSFLALAMQQALAEALDPMRRLVLILLVALVAFTLGVGANGGIELRGHLTANETEMQEGYFAVAQDTVLMVRPGSELHGWLKQHQGQIVRLVVEPAATR